MSSGIQKADMQRQVSVKLLTMIREHVKCMPEEIAVFITVPAPGCIGVRIVTWAGTGIDSFFGTVTDPMTIRG